MLTEQGITMADEISNTQDIIDSRDVTDRIEELEAEEAEALESGEEFDAAEELTTLRAFAKEASDYVSDWRYGAALIHEDYFVEYAQQMAEDIGAIDSDAGWPASYIDWDAAADALKMDYTSVDFDGQTYWGRS